MNLRHPQPRKHDSGLTPAAVMTEEQILQEADRITRRRKTVALIDQELACRCQLVSFDSTGERHRFSLSTECLRMIAEVMLAEFDAANPKGGAV
jgi:hypothetical protein